jgi:hypothetical protein
MRELVIGLNESVSIVVAFQLAGLEDAIQPARGASLVRPSKYPATT